jgi:hypothetical protein
MRDLPAAAWWTKATGTLNREARGTRRGGQGVRTIHRPGTEGVGAGAGGSAPAQSQLHRHRAHSSRVDPRGRGRRREGTARWTSTWTPCAGRWRLRDEERKLLSDGRAAEDEWLVAVRVQEAGLAREDAADSAGQPRMPRFGAPQYRPAASVRGRQPRPLSLASLALTDPSEYGLRLRPPTGAAGYSSGDSPWKATHTG